MAILVALWAFGTAAASPLGEARELFKNKQYDRAREILAPVVEGLHGEDRDEGFLLLAALETSVDRAVAIYERVIASGGESAALEAALELSSIQYARGEYRSAIEVLSPREHRPVSRDPAAHYLRGLCCRQIHENARARAEFGRVDRGPYVPWSALALADIDAEEGDYARALERYEALGGKTSSPIARFKLGECYEKLGEREKALETYRALVTAFPRSLEAAQGKEKIALLGRPGGEPAAKSPKGGEEGTATTGAPAAASIRDGYAIQLGAFSERENAIRMAKQIEKIVADVRIETVPSGNRTLHRVRAGRYASRAAAERDAALIRQRLGLSCAIVPLR